jgi:nucleoside-diphosphate-sugar epimerase
LKNIIITGSNGMIGKLVLENCLKRDDVNKITSITRRTTGITHEKLIEVIHDDFLDYSNIEEHFKNQDVCFYCIGVYTGQVPTDEFKKITVEFTKVFSQTIKRNNENTIFCFLSGQGADSSERSPILFAKQKGIAENYLLNLYFKKTHIFRPGYIYPDIPRKEPNLSYKILRILYPVLSKVYSNIGITSTKLAEKMVDIGMNGGDRVIYENKFIRS